MVCVKIFAYAVGVIIHTLKTNSLLDFLEEVKTWMN